MLQSRLFSKTAREAPKDESSKNARLLEQAGFIQKSMAGVYTFLPLGSRVLYKIENIVRQEMDSLGSEMLMPALHPKGNWEQTGRWDGLEILFKIESQHGFEYALGPTHEEIVTPAAKKAIASYRDLPKDNPLAVYQIQTKFRDELRAKSGLLRGREFRMKDLYSFHAGQQDLETYYQKVQARYFAVYERVKLSAILTEASGGSFSKYSHEFQVQIDGGEDTIFVCSHCDLQSLSGQRPAQAWAKNREIFNGTAADTEEKCTSCGKNEWTEIRAAEVGNIFKLGTKFSDAFGLTYVDKDGKEQPVVMGCYGLGTSRLMGVIAEKFSDEFGLRWPESVAPFGFHIIALYGNDQEANVKVTEYAKKAYQFLKDLNVDVLLDDRDERSGVKLVDSDLIGIPWKWIISEKNFTGEAVETHSRQETPGKILSAKEKEVITKKSAYRSVIQEQIPEFNRSFFSQNKQ